MAIVRDIMPAFELFQPASVEDALVLLDKHREDAWVFAGGLDTFDWLTMRCACSRNMARMPGCWPAASTVSTG